MFSRVNQFFSKLSGSRRTQEKAQRHAALFRLSAELAAALEEEQVCYRVVEGLHETLGYDFVALCLVEADSGDRIRVAGVGYDDAPVRLVPGTGLSERPLLDGQLHYTPDVSQEPAFVPGLGGSEVDVPIYIGGQVEGVLIAESRLLDDFDQRDFEVLTAAAQQAGLALEKSRLLAAERQRADELDALYTTLTEITAELELTTLLHAIVERAAGLMQSDAGELGLIDEARDEIEIVVSFNLLGDHVGERQAIGEGAMGHVVATGQPLILNNYQAWDEALSHYPDIHGTIAVPLQVGDRLVGVFTTVSTDPQRQFTPADQHLLSLFAHQAAIAIDNARLYKKAQHEIFERTKIEAEILRQKEYFEALFVNNPVAVVTAGLDGHIVSWNPTAEQLFGYSQAEVIGRHLDDIVAPDESIHAEAHGYTDQVINTGRVQATVKRLRKDGSYIFADLLALPVIVSGQMVGFIAIYHDIGQRLQMEKEIRRQKEYFEALFVNNPVAVITVDLDGLVVSWNPASARLFGYTREEAIGQHIDDLVTKDPDIRAEARRYSQQATTGQTVQTITKRNRKDGSTVDVEVLALPVVVGGERVGYLAIYYDISDLQDARRQAESANQAKSTFLANMSHELRTPLNAILGFTRLMEHDPNLTHLQTDNLEIINRSGEHLHNLINSVLEMSKIEAGRVSLQIKSFDLFLLLDTLEDTFRLHAEDKGLELVFQRGPGVPQYVVTDDGKLRQILLNLVGNAIKFTDSGSVGLGVTVCPPGDPGQENKVRLLFEVQDSGPGIAPDDLPVIFEPFVQARGAPQFHEGTGLGLSISRQFVRMLDGEITVSSAPSQGSTFRFDLQVELADESEVLVSRRARRVLALEPGQPTYRLLVVEDRDTNRQLLVRLLEPLGFEIHTAANGHEALLMWERWQPHLVWMDMQMPYMDGYETTRRIKASPHGGDTIIIALTATAFEDDRHRAISAGCDDFLRKPFKQEEVFNLLVEHLDVHFIYEQETAPAAPRMPSTASPDGEHEITPAALNRLPPELLDELKVELIRADLSRIQQLLEQVRAQDDTLGQGLGQLVDNFEFDHLLALIDQAGNHGKT